MEAPKAKAATVVNDMSRKTGDWATYKYYTRALGRWPLAIFVSLIATNQIFTGMCSKSDSSKLYTLADSYLAVWLKLWAADNEAGGQKPLGYWLGIYALFSSVQGIGMCAAIA